MRAGSKSYTAPRPWQSWQAPCGELNENARGVISGMLMPQFGHAMPPREQPIAAVERVDDDDVVGELEGEIDRIGQPALDAGLDDQAIDEHVDRVVLPPIELDLIVERDELAVDARAREAALRGARRARA